MNDRKIRRIKIREDLTAGRTVFCSTCEVNYRIGLRKRDICPTCGNILPKPTIEKMELIDRWRIKTLNQKISFVIIVLIVIWVIVSFGIATWVANQLSS